jgi:putative endopeptidase
MTAATKEQAQVKLAGIANKVGHPEHFRDYSSIVVKREDPLGNAQRASAFEFRRQLDKIGKPVDRQEWGMTPPTVNAYYNASMNDINFPAGILQPPFFDAGRDEAFNYGGIGAVIGHELTHGFDDQGRKFDAKGNLRDWWTADDAREFEKRTGCIVDEYSKFEPVAGVHLNGKLTLGENTADNGGLRIAYMAYQKALAAGQAPDKDVDGFTPLQRVFLGWSQVWCENRTEQVSRMLAGVDPHSPGRFRVNGVVSNMPEFQQAFSCPAGKPMVREDRCHVW